MVKNKLIAVRTEQGFSQKEIADRLYMDQSQYSRREKGIIKITEDEWDKLSQILSVPVEDIFESDESQVHIYGDQSVGINNGGGSNTFYSVPEYLLESQKKYIEKLEEENAQLREALKAKG